MDKYILNNLKIDPNLNTSLPPKQYFIKNIGIDVITLIWDAKPRTFNDWVFILKKNDFYSKLGKLANSYAKQNLLDGDALFKEYSDLFGYKTFSGYKRELRTILWAKTKGYTVTKSTKYEDINLHIDLFAIKNGKNYAVQVKSTTKGDEQEIYEFTQFCKKLNLIPVVVIVTPRNIYWSTTKYIQAAEKWYIENVLNKKSQ